MLRIKLWVYNYQKFHQNSIYLLIFFIKIVHKYHKTIYDLSEK